MLEWNTNDPTFWDLGTDSYPVGKTAKLMCGLCHHPFKILVWLTDQQGSDQAAKSFAFGSCVGQNEGDGEKKTPS